MVRPIGKIKAAGFGGKSKAAKSAPAHNTAPTTSGPEAETGVAGNLLSLQHSVGNRAVDRLVQTKLTVGPAQDRYEREADQVAHQAAARTSPTETKISKTDYRNPLANKITPLTRNQIVLREEESVRRKPEGGSNESSAPVGRRLERNLADSKGDGRPLPTKTRVEMESQFGVDFRNVRLHTGNDASRLTNSMKAEAFTSGKDIYLGEGKFQPESTQGRELLAHELTHVVQQATGVEQGAVEDSEIGHINRKKVQRQLDFFKVKRKNAGVVKEVLRQMKIQKKDNGDPHTHYWSEVARTDRGGYEPQESHGWWPSAGPESASVMTHGVPGMLNAFLKSSKGSRTRDPHHGDTKPDDEYHPVIEMDDTEKYDKFHDNFAKEIRSFARGYREQWNWRSRWGQNTEGFQKRLMRKFKMEEPKRRTPMLYNPRFMLNSAVQEHIENATEFARVQEVFEKYADKGGGSLAEMMTSGGLSAGDLYSAFDVMPEEQEGRAEMLAALNPQVSKDELLKEVQGR